jgi:hypothetical protein
MLTAETIHDRTSLRKWNLVNAIIYLIQAVIQLILYYNIDKFHDSSFPININSRNVGSLNIGWLVSTFLFVTFLSHFLALLRFRGYIDQIERNINYYRWIEYSITSTIILIIISLFFGIFDLSLLVMIGASNVALIYTRVMMEKINKSNEIRVEWSPFILSCLLGTLPWITILIYLFDGELDSIPDFVYTIGVSYFIFFQSFSVNMYLYYKRVGNWRSYAHTERCYQMISVVSKSLVSWLVFSGLNQQDRK